MPPKGSEAVPEGNGPILHQEEFGSGQPTMEDVYRMMKEAFDRWDRKLDEIWDKMEEYIERTNEYRSAFDTPVAWRSAATSCH